MADYYNGSIWSTIVFKVYHGSRSTLWCAGLFSGFDGVCVLVYVCVFFEYEVLRINGHVHYYPFCSKIKYGGWRRIKKESKARFFM